MKKFFLTPKTLICLGLFLVVGLTSCTSTRELNYFDDLPDSDVISLPPLPQEERVVEKGDQLQINITARSSEAASFFNKGGGVPTPNPNATDATASAAPSYNSANYIVDVNGFIEFPIIGKVRASGLTANQLKDNLTKVLSTYLKEPLVEVLFTTFNVTLLGEVKSPGTKILSMQRTTLLEGLAAGGDLTTIAKRHDIHLYRDYKGERKIYKFDLRKKDVLNNRDVFQLRHNDVIYVQLRPGTVTRENIGLYTSFISIALGLATLGVAIARNNN